MSDLATLLQDAIYAALNVTAVTDLAPVYQHVPENTDPPVVIIGEIELQPRGGKDGGLYSADVQIATLFRGPKRAGLYAIQGAVSDALEGQEITATGAILSKPVLIDRNGDMTEDGITYQGVQTYEVWVQPA